MAPKRQASEIICIRVTPDEKTKLESAAEAEDLSVSGLLRQCAGLPVRERGGAMPGAGRPRKVKASAPTPE